MRKQLNFFLALVLVALPMAGCGSRDRATSIAIRTANAFAILEGVHDAVAGLQDFGELSTTINRRAVFLPIADGLDAFAFAARSGDWTAADTKIKTVIQLVRDLNRSNVFGIKSDNTRRAVAEWLGVAEIWVANIKLLVDKKPTQSAAMKVQVRRAQNASRDISPGSIAFISSLFGSVALTAQSHYDLDKDGAWQAAGAISARLRTKLGN